MSFVKVTDCMAHLPWMWFKSWLFRSFGSFLSFFHVFSIDPKASFESMYSRNPSSWTSPSFGSNALEKLKLSLSASSLRLQASGALARPCYAHVCVKFDVGHRSFGLLYVHFCECESYYWHV